MQLVKNYLISYNITYDFFVWNKSIYYLSRKGLHHVIYLACVILFYYIMWFFDVYRPRWYNLCLYYIYIYIYIYIYTYMLLRCCLLHKAIIILEHWSIILIIILKVYLCLCLGPGLFMSYLCDLFFIFSLMFIVINHITLFKQTYLFCKVFRISPIIFGW